MEARITELETRFAYQERLLQELSDVLAGQQQQIDSLHADYDLILAHLKAMAATQTARPDDEPPPPHY